MNLAWVRAFPRDRVRNRLIGDYGSSLILPGLESDAAGGEGCLGNPVATGAGRDAGNGLASALTGPAARSLRDPDHPVVGADHHLGCG